MLDGATKCRTFFDFPKFSLTDIDGKCFQLNLELYAPCLDDRLVATIKSISSQGEEELRITACDRPVHQKQSPLH